MTLVAWPIFTRGDIDRFLIVLAGADPDIVKECPRDDTNNLRMLALIMLFVWLFQAAMWSVAAHAVLANPGEFRPGYVAFAALVATIVLCLDSYLVMRSGHHLHGQAEAKRAGMDISGGRLVRLKHGGFLLVRLAIAFGLAQLTALFMSFIVFASDIRGELEDTFRGRNADLFAAAASRVEREIVGALAARDESGIRLTAMTVEMARLRGIVVAPAVEEPRLRPALDRVARLEVAKADADRTVRAAEQFANDELRGVQRAPGNTGIPGAGPIRAAAEESLGLARAHASEARAELMAARTDLQEIQAGVREAEAQKRAQARERLDALATELQAERARQGGIDAQYRGLVDQREATIQDVVTRDPTHVPLARGFIAEMRALGRLANDRVSAGFVILFEAVGFAVECAAILGKVAGYAPTYFERRLATEHYLDALKHAQAIDRKHQEWEEATKRHAPDPPGVSPVSSAASQAPAASTNGSQPPRRKRGRPPKPRPAPEDPTSEEPSGEA